MKLKILETALETIRTLRPLMLRIRREDRGLHRQMTEAMNRGLEAMSAEIVT